MSAAGDISGLVESGDIVPILALSENRMSIAPDLQCSVENGIDSVMGPWRGIFAKKGTPQEAIDALVAAIEEAKQSDTWKEFTHNAAYDERPIPGSRAKRPLRSAIRSIRICTTTWSSRVPS